MDAGDPWAEQTEVFWVSPPKHPAIVSSFGVFGFRPVLTQQCQSAPRGEYCGNAAWDVFGDW